MFYSAITIERNPEPDLGMSHGPQVPTNGEDLHKCFCKKVIKLNTGMQKKHRQAVEKYEIKKKGRHFPESKIFKVG